MQCQRLDGAVEFKVQTQGVLVAAEQVPVGVVVRRTDGETHPRPEDAKLQVFRRHSGQGVHHLRGELERSFVRRCAREHAVR